MVCVIGGHHAADVLIKMSVGGVLVLVSLGFAPKIPNRSLRLALSLWLTGIGLQFAWQAVHR